MPPLVTCGVCSYGSQGYLPVATRSGLLTLTSTITQLEKWKMGAGSWARRGSHASFPPREIWKLKLFRNMCCKVTFNTGCFTWLAGQGTKDVTGFWSAKPPRPWNKARLAGGWFDRPLVGNRAGSCERTRPQEQHHGSLVFLS